MKGRRYIPLETRKFPVTFTKPSMVMAVLVGMVRDELRVVPDRSVVAAVFRS